MRERVTHLERRYGRKRVYLVSGIIVILVDKLRQTPCLDAEDR